MDIKEKIEEIVEKLKSDTTLLTRFKSEPIKVIEELIGIDLPDETIEKIVDGVKAKIDLDEVKDKLDDAKEAISGLMGLFGKKK
ncbi:MAG: hypothetical protein IJ493_01675 [Clostridia bacterium]|nr:hypothetical protein [Clostridia bacterium]